MILHTLNASPASNAFTDCLRLATAQDAILLLGDGVYSAIAASASYQLLSNCAAKVLILEADASATGSLARLGDFPLIDMDGFVALSENYPQQLAWY